MVVLNRLHINRFHVLVFFIWQIGLIFAAQQIFPIFYNYYPKRECVDSVNGGTGGGEKECTKSRQKKCEALKQCSNITVDEHPPFHSLVERFELYCDHQAYYATLIATIQFVGVLLGTITYGHLGDYFGRKPVALFALSIGVIAGVLGGVAPSWQLFAACRFIVGTSIAGVLVVLYTYVLELIQPEQRVFLRSFFNWGYARVIFTLVCFLFPHWRSASIATVCVVAPVIPVILLVIPESPKWLESKGRCEEARTAKRRIARLAGVPVSEENEEKAKEENKKTLSTIKDLLGNRAMAKRTLVMCFLWFATSLSAFGSDLSSGNNLGGNFFINQFSFAVAIAFAKIFTFIIDTFVPRFSRRHLHQIPQLGAFMCYAAIMAILMFRNGSTCDSDDDNFLDWTIVAVNVLGISLIEVTWDACYLSGVESFPTETRAIGMGTCSLSARIGALLAPQVLHLVKCEDLLQMDYLSNIYKPAPYAIVCIAGLCSLLVSFFFLTDTKGVELANISLDAKQKDPERRVNGA